MNRKEYLKKWREDNKEHIQNYKKEYAKTHDSSFKKLQDKYKQLEQENKILKENAENNDKVVDKVNWENMLLKKENKKQKDNWNKLKEIAKSQSGFKKRADLKGGLWFEVDDLLDKMQEMEKNYGNVEDNT